MAESYSTLSAKIPNDFPVLNADGTVKKPELTTQVQPMNAAGGPQSTAPGAAPAAGGASPWGAAGSSTGWLNQQLQDVQSTDDPGYWQAQAAKDPKFMAGDPGAVAWWKDAIQRGDGSMLVKNGTLTTRGSGGSTPGGGAASAGGWFANSGASAPSYSGGGVGAAPVAAGRGPEWDAFYQQLKGRSTQSLTPNANDPIIRAQTDAFDARQQRQARQSLEALAERGGPNTNLAAETRAANESAGQATSEYQANLLGNEVAARRAEIAQALSLQAGQMTTEEMSRLKQEDQALQARQQDIQNAQFGANLNQQESQFGRGLDLASNQQRWIQAFQERGWTADQAQRAWDDQYKTLFG